MEINLDTFYKFKSDEHLADVAFLNFEHVGLSCSIAYKEYPDSWESVRDFLLENIHIHGAEKWGGRGYSLQNGVFRNVRTDHVGVEHAWYYGCMRRLKHSDMVLWSRCFVRNVGGQAWQVIDREWEVHPDWREGYGPIVVLSRCGAANTAVLRPGNEGRYRGAYAYSFQAPDKNNFGDGQGSLKTPVVLADTVLDNRMQQTSRGMVNIEGRPWAQMVRCTMLSNPFGKDGPPGGPTAVLTTRIGDNGPKATARGLYVRGCHFGREEGTPDDYAVWDIEDVDPLWIYDCQGNLEVRRDGKSLGLLNKVKVEPATVHAINPS